MNYYNEIKEQLIKSEIYDKAKDYSKDRHKVNVYFEVGKKYNERTLRRIRQFYDIFANENGPQCGPNCAGVTIVKFYH